MIAAEAFLVDLDTGIRLHDGCAQIMLHLAQLCLSLEGAKEALSVQFDGVPYGDCVDMILQSDFTLPFISLQNPVISRGSGLLIVM